MNIGLISSKLLKLSLCNTLVRSIRIKPEPHTEYELKTNPNLVYRAFQPKSFRESSWLRYNKVIYPPKNIGPERPAEITGESLTNTVSAKHLYTFVKMVCGLSVEEALKQLYFRHVKAARVVEELIQDLIKDAVDQKIVEYPTNLWIENAHVSRGKAVKRIRHSHKRVIQVSNYHYSDVRIRLREGKPPAVYHPRDVFSGYEAMDRELERLRNKRIKLGL